MSVRTITGDCRDVLKMLPDRSVHCCVTSPPYFGLRDYGTGQWEGGNPDCEHRKLAYPAERETPGGRGGSMPMSETVFRDFCGLCGARRTDHQIGLEPTPDAFVAELVAVFAEVRRVLRDDGTLFLNLGDSYATGGGRVGSAPGGGKQGENWKLRGLMTPPNRLPLPGLKPKDLIGIPWRVAFALQADGWYLRQDIIWSKPNPMPESVRDRCTKAHEYIFLLSKRERYYFDAEAIREEAEYGRREWSDVAGNLAGVGINGKRGHATVSGGDPSAGRNKRSVWEVATQPFSEAHFATFPPALIEPCILAGCPSGGTVLDPFGGAGTTGLVADRLQRNAILIELNPAYAAMARRRIVDDAPLLVEAAE